ncbi:unnamed protein product [Rodentolepis nana]|uniref:Tantalus domain-containing protein n=1 Tax=Rodentolepis nana TaxID=102285 RepID=A0A0R3T933_RODNA|nr:unnamed protein product [Rodentolepis nana]
MPKKRTLPNSIRRRILRRRLRRRAFGRREKSKIVRKRDFGVQTELSLLSLESSLQTPASEIAQVLEISEITRLNAKPTESNCLHSIPQLASSTKELAENGKWTRQNNNEEIFEKSRHRLDSKLGNFTNGKPKVAILGETTHTGDALTQEEKVLETPQKTFTWSRKETIFNTQRSEDFCDSAYSSCNRANAKPLETSLSPTKAHICRTPIATNLTTPSYMAPTIASVRKISTSISRNYNLEMNTRQLAQHKHSAPKTTSRRSLSLDDISILKANQEYDNPTGSK